MKQEETLILRESDKGNQIQFIFNDLSSITSAEFRLIKPDETFVISTGEIDTENNIITFDINEQCCTVPGKGRFNIRLIGTDINVYTYVGRCIIDINLDLEHAVESTAEANGYTFPDDFLTSADLSNYATKTYVDTAIDHVPVYTPINYSFTEQKTGRKWVDGKDIYQKTLQFVSNDTFVNIADLNIDNVVDYKGLWKSSSNAFYTLDTLALWVDQASNSYFSRLVFADDISGVKVIVNGWTFASGFITLYYTKTTDTTNT